MKMEQSFEVAAPIDAVWQALIDVERVAPCLPGARITERDEDGSYKGTFEVRLGPTTASYRGVLRIEEADEAAHRAVLHARGTDKRGQGGATATIVNTLSEVGGATRVHADTDFTITGRLARFGRGGMIEDISNRLLREFATCLQSRLAVPAASEGVPGAGAGVPEAPVGAAAASVGAPGPSEAAPETGGDAAGTSDAGAGAPSDADPAGAAVVQASVSSGAGGDAGDSPASGTVAHGIPPRPPAPAAPPPPPAAKPVNGVTLILGVLYRRLARLFGRPGRSWGQ